MEYSVRIDQGNNSNGRLPLAHVELLSRAVQDLALGSFRIRVQGISFGPKGRTPNWVKEGGVVYLSGFSSTNHILKLECESIADNLTTESELIFGSEHTLAVAQSTPMQLVLETLNELVGNNFDSDIIDSGLLSVIAKLKELVKAGDAITFTNQRPGSDIRLSFELLNRINVDKTKSPEPKSIQVTGRLNLLQAKPPRVEINTFNGKVKALFTDDISVEEIRQYVNQYITANGLAFFKPSGKTDYLLLEKIQLATVDDSLFSNAPTSFSSEQQIINQLKDGKSRNPLNETAGKWVDDESLESILSDLK